LLFFLTLLANFIFSILHNHPIMTDFIARDLEHGSHPFIVMVEGMDFSGKTTLAQNIRSELEHKNYRVKLLHDPKGSLHAILIWETILTIKKQGGNPATEFFLFLAARNELIHQEALTGEVDVVIFDRFIFSTVAYQLAGNPEVWALFLKIHRTFSGLMPDVCIYCDIDFDTFDRRSKHRMKKDLFDYMDKNQFKATQTAYEQLLSLKWCPCIRMRDIQYDLAQVVEKIVGLLET